MKRSLIIVGLILAAFALAGGAFWGGMSVGQAQANSAAQNTRNFFANRGVDPNAAGGAGGTGVQGGGGGGGFFGAGGGAGTGGGQAGAAGAGARRGATGTVTKVDGNTITMTDQQGKTVTVNLANDTPIVKTTLGTTGDIKTGTRILVTGTRSGDNVSATQITIADMPPGVTSPFPGFGGGNRPTPAVTPSK
jgi:hypothetical protein